MAKTANGPMPWLKLWHEFLDSPKIQRVTESLRARYVNLLCVACKENDEGRLPDTEKVAFMIRLSVSETLETLDALANAGLIDRRLKCYAIHDWEYWQYHQSPGAIKQQRYRDRQHALRNGDGNALRNDLVTSTVTPPRASGSVSYSESSEGGNGGKIAPSVTESVTIPDPGPEFTALGNLAIEMSSVLALGAWVSNMARLGYSVATVRHALEQGAAASKWDQKWLQGICRRVHVEGIPEPPKGQAAKAAGVLPSQYVDPNTKRRNSEIAAAVAANIERRKREKEREAQEHDDA
jgi:hypothetical protein